MYETVTKIDEDIPVLTEKQIDEKYRARIIWEHYFLKDNDNPQLVLKQRNPKGEYHKIGGKFQIGDSSFGNRHNMIYLIPTGLIDYEMGMSMRIMENSGNEKPISKADMVKNTIRHLMHLSQYDNTGKMVKTFTYCEAKCAGFVEGHYVAESYNDIGSLSGSEGIDYKCIRCGSHLGSDVFRQS